MTEERFTNWMEEIQNFCDEHHFSVEGKEQIENMFLCKIAGHVLPELVGRTPANVNETREMLRDLQRRDWSKINREAKLFVEILRECRKQFVDMVEAAADNRK